MDYDTFARQQKEERKIENDRQALIIANDTNTRRETKPRAYCKEKARVLAEQQAKAAADA